MIGLRIRTDVRSVDRAFQRTRARGPRITAQELNTQRRQSRTRITRKLGAALGVRPLRRIRDRVRLPRAGLARPERLKAWGLALVHIMPARWWVRGRARARLALPAGLKLIEGAPATGAPFLAEAKYTGEVFRRGAEPRTRTAPDGDPTWLPIKRQNVDTESQGDRAIEQTVAELAREWPARYQARMRRELRRIWGA